MPTPVCAQHLHGTCATFLAVQAVLVACMFSWVGESSGTIPNNNNNHTLDNNKNSSSGEAARPYDDEPIAEAWRLALAIVALALGSASQWLALTPSKRSSALIQAVCGAEEALFVCGSVAVMALLTPWPQLAICLAALGLAAHALRVSADFLLFEAISRADTDGSAGILIGPVLRRLDARACFVPFVAACGCGGLIFSSLLVVAPSAVAPLVWSQALAYLALLWAHAQRLLEGVAIAESVERFESIFCTANELRVGAVMGIVSHIPDEEGGIIISLSRTDRWHPVEQRHALWRAGLMLVQRALFAWLLVLLAAPQPQGGRA